MLSIKKRNQHDQNTGKIAFDRVFVQYPGFGISPGLQLLCSESSHLVHVLVIRIIYMLFIEKLQRIFFENLSKSEQKLIYSNIEIIRKHKNQQLLDCLHWAFNGIFIQTKQSSTYRQKVRDYSTSNRLFAKRISNNIGVVVNTKG